MIRLLFVILLAAWIARYPLRRLVDAFAEGGARTLAATEAAAEEIFALWAEID